MEQSVLDSKTSIEPVFSVNREQPKMLVKSSDDDCNGGQACPQKAREQSAVAQYHSPPPLQRQYYITTLYFIDSITFSNPVNCALYMLQQHSSLQHCHRNNIHQRCQCVLIPTYCDSYRWLMNNVVRSYKLLVHYPPPPPLSIANLPFHTNAKLPHLHHSHF